jgi:hypothetical protein
VAEIMKEIGAKLSQALTEKGDGAQLLQNITSILQNPQSAIENKGV